MNKRQKKKEVTKLIKQFTEQKLSERKKGDPPVNIMIDIVNDQLILSDNETTHNNLIKLIKENPKPKKNN